MRVPLARTVTLRGNGYCVVCKNLAPMEVLEGKLLISIHPSCIKFYRGKLFQYADESSKHNPAYNPEVAR